MFTRAGRESVFIWDSRRGQNPHGRFKIDKKHCAGIQERTSSSFDHTKVEEVYFHWDVVDEYFRTSAHAVGILKSTVVWNDLYILIQSSWSITYIPYSLASQMGHQLSTQADIYTEHMRSGTAKYHKLPAMLLCIEAGLSTKKPN